MAKAPTRAILNSCSEPGGGNLGCNDMASEALLELRRRHRARALSIGGTRPVGPKPIRIKWLRVKFTEERLYIRIVISQLVTCPHCLHVNAIVEKILETDSRTCAAGRSGGPPRARVPLRKALSLQMIRLDLRGLPGISNNGSLDY
jgi:hypothetical protein